MLRVLDVETTDKEGEVIEIGWTDVVQDGAEWRVGQTKAHLCDPGVLIEFGAMGTHHITDEMVQGQPLLTEIIRDHRVFDEDVVDCFVAHNAKYEQARLRELLPVKPWICTWKVSLRLAPKATSHTNQAMRYLLRLDKTEGFEPDRASPPHRAGPDTYITAHLVARAAQKLSIEEMIEISSQPALLRVCPIGEKQGWRDRPFDEIDSGGLEWIVRTIRDNEDLVFTARYHLKQRNEGWKS